MIGRYVGYLRVSTERQGESGLGLDAQRSRILAFINGNGAEPVAWFTEIESGKRADRPELTKALEHCELTGATLVVSTLDRLTRDEAFLRAVRDAGVRFKCADMPDADELVIDIMARLARYEREKISQRTKAALSAAKARGMVLGNPRGAAPLVAHRSRGAERAGAVHASKADQWAEKRRSLLAELVANGMSNTAIAQTLNDRGIMTPREGKWTATSVRRLRERLGL
jgi:DNA invertase Pin-like site-specific DNA recombinase